MSNLIPGNHKHLSLDDRLYIEKSLNEGRSFKDIARFLCKDPSTISKEVRRHRALDSFHKGSVTNTSNFCIKRFQCRRTNVCEKLFLCERKCSSCFKCNQVCKHFVKEGCHRLSRAPYVCNGCLKPLHRCTIAAKYNYNALFAERKYKEVLVSSRVGINLTREQLHAIDSVVTPLIANGQSPYQIVTNHPELGISVRTLYQYIEQGILLARNIDLKRKPRFKPRKSHQIQISNREIFLGRTFLDFQDLMPEQVVEMDTVISAGNSRKVLLTFYFRKQKLFLAFLLNRKTSAEVRRVFDRLETRLDTYLFLSLFETILTDRGTEFGDPEALETGIHDIQRTSIYYCDPMQSCQKGGVENVHTMLRNVLPKGSSFELLTQWDVNLIVNHINSTPRASLNGQTPYQAAHRDFGPDILSTLHLKPVAPDKVQLAPKLIK